MAQYDEEPDVEVDELEQAREAMALIKRFQEDDDFADEVIKQRNSRRKPSAQMPAEIVEEMRGKMPAELRWLVPHLAEVMIPVLLRAMPRTKAMDDLEDQDIQRQVRKMGQRKNSSEALKLAFEHAKRRHGIA